MPLSIFFFEWNKPIRALSIRLQLLVFCFFTKHRIAYNPGIRIRIYIVHSTFLIKIRRAACISTIIIKLNIKIYIRIPNFYRHKASSIQPTNQPTKPLNIETFNLIPISIAKAICSCLLLLFEIQLPFCRLDCIQSLKLAQNRIFHFKQN